PSGRVPIPMSVATDQTIQIANIRRRSRPWNGRESAGKALRRGQQKHPSNEVDEHRRDPEDEEVRPASEEPDDRTGDEQRASERQGEGPVEGKPDLSTQAGGRRMLTRDHGSSMGLWFMNLMYELFEQRRPPGQGAILRTGRSLVRGPCREFHIRSRLSRAGGTIQCPHSPRTPSRTAFESDRTTM